MAALSAIRTQFYDLIRETSGDSHLTDVQVNSLANQTQRLIAPIIELPRKTSSDTAVTQGMGSITLPTDNLLILEAYIGDPAILNDIHPLTIIKEELINQIMPSWMQTNAGFQDRPVYFFERTQTTGMLVPPANAAESASGKIVRFTYVYNPTDLSADSDTPPFPLPYHDIMKFMMASIFYDSAGNTDKSTAMLNKFTYLHNQIKDASLTEARPAMRFQWGNEF